MLLRPCLIAVATSLSTSALAQVPPPAPETEKKEVGQDDEAEGSAGLGLAPAQPEYGGEVTTSTPATPKTVAAAGQGSHFELHGYFRAPMRIGVGARTDGSEGSELHAPPRVPDGSFTDWRYLDNLQGPWAELMFSYGNPRAKATVSIASYNQTVAGYRELQAQLGINQAFLTLNFPGAFGRYGDLTLVAGSFSNRYGTAGKYDAGMYETYLFGRTKAAGETLTARLDLSRDVSVYVEHGVGAKLDVIPFDTVNPRPDYLPFPGPVPQGSTFLHHAHLGVELMKKLRVTGHYLTSWTPDDNPAPGQMSDPGRMTVIGAEAKLKGGVAGDGFIGFSQVRADDILPLADALEVLHSSGGWQFKNNYFGRFDPRTGVTPPDDTGAVNSLLVQYSLSIGKLVRYPARFSGNGPDLSVTVFGMFNDVDSENFAHQKLKYGGEVVYSPLELLALGMRADLVQPDLDDNNQSFAVLSPKLILRTAFLSHERVLLQYSHYFNQEAVYPAFPYNRLPEADKDVLMLSASMWW
jgi:hypothetical protein